MREYRRFLRMTKLEELEKVNTPEELFDFLKANIKYGVIDKNGNK